MYSFGSRAGARSRSPRRIIVFGTSILAVLIIELVGLRLTGAIRPGAQALASCGPLTMVSGQVIAGQSTDQFSWSDSSCQPRSTALLQSDPKGGSALQFTYQVAGSPRVVGLSPAGAAAGFGYIVSHLYDASLANNNGEDDSPLGSNLDNLNQVVFVGSNHAIFEYTLNYPRWGTDPGTGVVTKYNMPVTIHWVFATGRDNPLWAVTFDLSQAPANAIYADTRAPYGDMNIDGATTGNWGDDVGGVVWGESFKFLNTGVPLTLNSAWDWSAPNTGAPYNAIWTQNVDAEMGIAGTLISTKEDAGGYQGGAGRGTTSATVADRCPANSENHVMPCTWAWAYQSVNYSFTDNSSTTGSKRLAWGSDWGRLGSQSVTTINGNTVTGWPLVSYSTFIVLGPHSTNPTENVAGQATVINGTTLTATVGTVLTSGPAGVNRTDTVAYSPAGYNPVYATWEANASKKKATLKFNVAGTTPLTNPVIVLHQYTGGAIPGTVTLDGVAQHNGTGYFVSYRADTQDLWLTLAASLKGSHTLVVDGTVDLATQTPTPSATRTSTVTPTMTVTPTVTVTPTITVTSTIAATATPIPSETPLPPGTHILYLPDAPNHVVDSGTP